MKKCLFFVGLVCLLSTFKSDALNINIGLHLPDLRLGIAVELLIDASLVLEILNRPVDLNKTMACGTSAPHAPPTRNGLSSGNKRWYKNNDGTWFVAVVMGDGFTSDDINTIYAGMINIQNNSCMRFYVYNEADLSGYDYVKIESGTNGCYSQYIGRAFVGKQTVNLQPQDSNGLTCIIAGIAAHELLHAIGFDHEQNTPGRNSYVTINYGNIISGYEHNFDEDSSSSYTAFGQPYDYGSVMHYGIYSFSSNGQQTIVVLNGASVGQRNGVSQIDGVKVNKMHGC